MMRRPASESTGDLRPSVTFGRRDGQRRNPPAPWSRLNRSVTGGQGGRRMLSPHTYLAECGIVRSAGEAGSGVCRGVTGASF